MNDTLPLSKRIYAGLPPAVKPGIQLARRTVRAWFRGGYPRIFLNSVPKAGTHLLTSLLDAMGYRLYSNQPFNPSVVLEYDPRGFRPHLDRVLPGEYLLEHLAWHKTVEEMLTESGFKTVFIHRDPRAAAVSFSRYVAEKHPHHRLHPYYAGLPDLAARVRATLDGVSGEHSRNKIGRAPLADLYDAFLPWKRSARVYSVSFEDLVGERGGGSRERQMRAVEGLFEHLGVEGGEGRVRRAADSVFDEGSMTFRSAQIDGWRAEVPPETAALLDRSLERQLREWGCS